MLPPCLCMLLYIWLVSRWLCSSVRLQPPTQAAKQQASRGRPAAGLWGRTSSTVRLGRTCAHPGARRRCFHTSSLWPASAFDSSRPALSSAYLLLSAVGPTVTQPWFSGRFSSTGEGILGWRAVSWVAGVITEPREFVLAFAQQIYAGVAWPATPAQQVLPGTPQILISFKARNCAQQGLHQRLL